MFGDSEQRRNTFPAKSHTIVLEEDDHAELSAVLPIEETIQRQISNKTIQEESVNTSELEVSELAESSSLTIEEAKPKEKRRLTMRKLDN